MHPLRILFIQLDNLILYYFGYRGFLLYFYYKELFYGSCVILKGSMFRSGAVKTVFLAWATTASTTVFAAFAENPFKEQERGASNDSPSCNGLKFGGHCFVRATSFLQDFCYKREN